MKSIILTLFLLLTGCDKDKNNSSHSGAQRTCNNDQRYDSSAQKCVPICKDGFELDSITLECRPPKKPISCTSNQIILPSGECGCPSLNFWNKETLKCEKIPNCPPGFTVSADFMKCISPCKNGFFYNHDKKRCELPCKDGHKFDVQFQRCIPVCEGTSYSSDDKTTCIEAKFLKLLSDRPSILRKIYDVDRVKVCISANFNIKRVKLDSIRQNVSKSLLAWTRPLKGVDPDYQWNQKIDFDVKIRQFCPKETVVTYYVREKGNMPGGGSRAFANFYNGRHEIWLTENSSYSTFLHEFGHLIGIEDHYDEGTFMPIKGYNCDMSIMCSSDDFLKPSDIEAVKFIFCDQLSSSAECNNFMLKINHKL